VLFKLTTWLAVRTSSRIITVSRHSRDDIAYYYRIPKERIAVTPEAADKRFCPQPDEQVADVRRTYNLPPRYVLYLGSNKPHKNLERLVRAWERLVQEHRGQHTLPVLVIAGHYDPNYPEAQQMVAERALSDTVLFVPNVAEEDVPALYTGAEVFVFPSYYEGFGLPPLEAMACGTPVLCAYASSLPEVVNDAALTFDPYNFIELAGQLARVLGSAPLREHLRARGLEQAREFSWRRTAQQTLFVYQDVQRERRA
jgi:alpha-1,3-rhamnosyl/mannosyltransferase